MGELASWGRSTLAAFERARFRLLLSGTPFRSDNSPIPWVTYDDDGVSQRRLRLRLHGGADRRRLPPGHLPHLRRRHGVGLRRPPPARRLHRRAARRRGRPAPAHRAGPRGRLGRPRARRRAPRADRPARRRAPRRRRARDRRRQGARREARRPARRGSPASARTIVTSDAPDASARIARFAAGTGTWLVSVLMVSEGVDVPRLRVGVYATSARTELFFRQVVGRFIRRTPAPQPSDVAPVPAQRPDAQAARERRSRRSATTRSSPSPRARRSSAASAASPPTRSTRCPRAPAATTTCCRPPRPATRCSCSPTPPRRRRRRWPRSAAASPRPRRRRPPPRRPRARRRDRLREARAPARGAPQPRQHDLAPHRRGAPRRSTRASTATSARPRSPSRPSSSSRRPTSLLEREAARVVAMDALPDWPDGHGRGAHHPRAARRDPGLARRCAPATARARRRPRPAPRARSSSCAPTRAARSPCSPRGDHAFTAHGRAVAFAEPGPRRRGPDRGRRDRRPRPPAFEIDAGVHVALDRRDGERDRDAAARAALRALLP